ncbi:MAG: hypothetical protein EBV03_14270, partial [Proteobacteria bacterium]|nr:hypothetical protein [Pseudomonadota bacterium]
FIICSKKEKPRVSLISFLIKEGYIKYAIYFIQKLRVSLSGSAYHLTNLLSTLNSWIPEEGIEPHPHMDLYELSTQLLHLVNSLSEERSFSDTRSSTTPPDNLFFFFLKTLRARKEFGILLMTFPRLILIEDFLVQLSDGTNKPCTLFEISIHFKSPELVIEVIHQLQLRNLLFQEDGSPSEFFNLKRINLISLFFDQPVLYQIIHNVVSDRFPLLAPELLNQFSLNFFCRNTGKLLEKMREQVDLFKILPTDLLTKWKLINPSNIRTTFMKQTLALQKAYYAQCLAEVERLEKAISEKKADLMTKKENQKEVAAKKETLVEALNAVKNQSALELKELED